MNNLHTPQRLEGETRDQYVIRRAESNRYAKAIAHGVPLQHLSLVSKKMRMRKHPVQGVAKPVKVRVRKPKQPIKATWPKSDDQVLQSRPVIVMHPVRALALKFLSSNPPGKGGVRTLTSRQSATVARAHFAPKHLVDQLAA
ncbi:hypothetical protein [Rhodoferax sp. GW822-FHT02A01]|uniref:hypothetical protein n=1 Tax=Rhodoferax sp. GW822-FHT02A01 TaxID=3141537 RepID=UPI00315DA9ED